MAAKTKIAKRQKLANKPLIESPCFKGHMTNTSLILTNNIQTCYYFCFVNILQSHKNNKLQVKLTVCGPQSTHCFLHCGSLDYAKFMLFNKELIADSAV